MKSYIWYFKDLRKYLNTKKSDSAAFQVKLHPKLEDRKDSSGIMSGHYFHQDLLVAQKIFYNKPERHLDIGSSTYGFVSHIASFREIDVLDIRENTSKVKNINFRILDIMSDEMTLDIQYDSLSCLHTIEHFGLGRYNDTVDYDGYKKGLNNIAKLISTEGLFYLSTPIGKQAIYFNAHRVFNHQHILEICEPHFNLIEFHVVDNKGDLVLDVPIDSFISEEIKGRLGIFVFHRK